MFGLIKTALQSGDCIFCGSRFTVSQISVALSAFQGLEIFWTIDPGRRSQTRFALGYFISGLWPYSERISVSSGPLPFQRFEYGHLKIAAHFHGQPSGKEFEV